MTHAERKAKIVEIRAAAAKLYGEAHELQSGCDHKILIREKDHRGWYGSGECAGCFADFGWYCPDSPDHACHYYTTNGKVILIDGTETAPPPGHNEDREDCDWCIFCGSPDERK